MLSLDILRAHSRHSHLIESFLKRSAARVDAVDDADVRARFGTLLSVVRARVASGVRDVDARAFMLLLGRVWGASELARVASFDAIGVEVLRRWLGLRNEKLDKAVAFETMSTTTSSKL